MTACRYCRGRGVVSDDKPERPGNLRGAAAEAAGGKLLPPFGREVMDALRSDRLHYSALTQLPTVEVFAGPCRITGKDGFQLAAQVRERSGDGSAIALPADSDGTGFRWPPVPCYVVWGFSLTPQAIDALVRVLIDSGVGTVQVLGHAAGPQLFEAV